MFRCQSNLATRSDVGGALEQHVVEYHRRVLLTGTVMHTVKLC